MVVAATVGATAVFLVLAMKPENPGRLADAHSLDMAGAANAAIQIH